MVLFLYTKEISPVIGEKQNVIDLKMHSKQCMQLLFLEYCLSFILKEIFVCESELFFDSPKGRHYENQSLPVSHKWPIYR